MYIHIYIHIYIENIAVTAVNVLYLYLAYQVVSFLKHTAAVATVVATTFSRRRSKNRRPVQERWGPRRKPSHGDWGTINTLW
jgi:hypothetical protein